MIIDFEEAKARLRVVEIEKNIEEFAAKMDVAIDEYKYYSGFAVHKNFCPLPNIKYLERATTEYVMSLPNNPDDFSPDAA